VPVLLALAGWVALARRGLQRDAHEVFWLRVGAAVGLLGIAVQSIFETPLRVPANALLAAVLAAIVVHERQRRADLRDHTA